MKIACLQFAPQVGDVDNNLNRADSILNKAKTSDLEDLDLLVLPELAFSGYNFTSLQHITPFLEPPGSGISSLWARTTALKYDCAVVVGYPEKVDVTAQWPASPEYYNSALIVNGDGDTIANYRKSFLYYTDETWALEGKEGFFRGEIPRVGSTALGICMDLNPYRFEAEWDAFEFGFHALESEANVVILTMAWTTQQDHRIFSRRPQDPDIETLVYWVQRLEPLIRAEMEGEIIVVFCNRCGTEDDVTYAGTSAVLGILQGEVYVYGVLGRGVKDLLVVDTDNLPSSKLIDAANLDTQQSYVGEVAEYLEMDPTEVVEESSPDVLEEEPEMVSQRELASECAIISDDEDEELAPLSSSFSSLQQQSQPEGRINNLRSQLKLVIPTRPAISDPTPIDIDSAIDDDMMYSAIDDDDDDDIIIDSPGVTNPPSPVQNMTAPKLKVPSSPWRFRRKPTWQQPDGPQPQVFSGGKVCMTPITPFDTGSPILSAKSAQVPQSALAWRPAQLIYENIPEAIQEDEVQVQAPTKPSRQSSRQSSRQTSRERGYSQIIALDSPEKLRYQEVKQQAIQMPDAAINSEEGTSDTSHVEDENKTEVVENDGDESPVPDLGELSAILERLRLAEGCTPSSLPDNRLPQPPYEPAQSPCPERPFSPKSLNASRNGSRAQSRSRLMQLRDPASDERLTSISRGTIPISVSPSVFDSEYYRPQSIPISASPSIFSNTDAMNSPIASIARPESRLGDRTSKPAAEDIGQRYLNVNGRSLSLPSIHETRPEKRSASIAGYRDIGANRHHRRRSSLRITTTNLDEPSRIVSRDGSRTRRKASQNGKDRRRRNVSRGRQPAKRGTSVDRSNSVGERKVHVSLSRRQSLQSRPYTETGEAKPQKRTRASSARERRRQPAPLSQVSAVDVALPSDRDTEIETDEGDAIGADDALIGSIKRIAADCPHHSPFRRSHRQQRDEVVPPPPPLPPSRGATSLLSFAFALSQSGMSAGGGLLSASSTEGFSEGSPMSPETPRFFGGNGNGSGKGDRESDRTVILSEIVSGSTVTSPSEHLQMQMRMKVDEIIEGKDGDVKGSIAKVDIETVDVDVSMDKGGEENLVAVS